MDSATAKKKFQHLNNITTTLDFNSLDNGSSQVSQQDDPLYLQRVVMSDVALLKMVKHTSSNNCKPMEVLFEEVQKGRKELGGLFKGKVCGDAILVMDAFVLPLDDNLDFHSNLLDYFETRLQTGGLEDVVGWYRTSTIGGYPTKTDLSTQVHIQKLKDPSFALVIDGGTTIDILKARVQAFRTYPEGYTPMNRKRNRPELIFKVFPFLEKRYRLPVTYFKSSLDNNDAWEIFWNHLISTPKTPGKTIGLEVSENKENLGGPDEKNKIMCQVLVKRELTKQYSSPMKAIEGLYSKLVKDVGSSESGSRIRSIQKSVFFAPLTQDEAKKLADHEYVESLREVPWDYYRMINSCPPYGQAYAH
ncbi:uncharacterized protein LOC141595898 [Silene latifolia]|uniref:uncharacterized protein LOC141595898 n=1 Tax=Silene latifolia TaxID=37657 RepID=UPI003D780CC6